MNQAVTTEVALETAEWSEHPVQKPSLEGKRLEEARAEFRAAWAAKVSEKRGQAAWARMRAASLHRLTREIQVGSMLLGAVAGPLLLPGAHGFLDFLKVMLGGALLGLIVVVPLLFLTRSGAASHGRKAEQLEGAARDLERQVDCETNFDAARAEFRAAWSARLAEK